MRCNGQRNRAGLIGSVITTVLHQSEALEEEIITLTVYLTTQTITAQENGIQSFIYKEFSDPKSWVDSVHKDIANRTLHTTETSEGEQEVSPSKTDLRKDHSAVDLLTPWKIPAKPQSQSLIDKRAENVTFCPLDRLMKICLNQGLMRFT